jgi:hypothetical protein
MTGHRYYITTLGAWQRHASRFANSHWLALGEQSPSAALRVEDGGLKPAATKAGPQQSAAAPGDAAPILVLVEADEGAHLALEDDAAFEALPHALAQKPISDAAQAALATHGVAPGATTFDAAEAAARAHPLLRPRVF